MTEGPSPLGRPRSDAARLAVLYAVDDLLVEQGYAAMTMKGIAERAGVGKQTVYRWWSSKAEILFEAVQLDSRKELVVEPADSTAEELEEFRQRAVAFLTTSDAGAAYRALVGEAQHDKTVAELIRGADPLLAAALPVLARARDRGDVPANADLNTRALDLIGPIFYDVLADPVSRADPIRSTVPAEADQQLRTPGQ